MSLRFINKPEKKERELYERATTYFIDYFSKIESVKSLFRFGNITAPGISDIDLLVVFKNNEHCSLNGFENFPSEFNYLFTHGIMAVCEDHFYKNNYFTLWSDYHHLHGEDIAKNPAIAPTQPEKKALQEQTALEFLVANYIDIKMQRTYGIVKLRSFLQHMKGILYDLEYLSISTGTVYEMLVELRHWIKNWFDLKLTDQQLTVWLKDFEKAYDNFCAEIFSRHKMYLPMQIEYLIARNSKLISRDRIGYKHSGIILPKQLSMLGKKYTNLQNRFNHFKFYFPLIHQHPEKIIEDRFDFLGEMKTYNRKHLPNFMTITTSITSKII